ncbi:hypothetical protein [Citrobacter amalonaticus]
MVYSAALTFTIALFY